MVQTDKLHSFKRQLLVLIFYTILAAINTYPLLTDFTAILGPPEDNQLFVWNLWWFGFAVGELNSWPFYTDYLFYPEGSNLYFHTFSPLNCLIAVPLQPLIGLVPAYNLIMLFTFVLTAYGGYLLCRYLGFGAAAAFIGGQVISFNSFRLAHAGHHLNICSTYLLPFLLLYALKAIESKKAREVIVAGILFGLNSYLDFYMFLFGFVVLIGLIFFRLPGGKFTIWGQIKSVLPILLIGTALAAPLMIPAFSEAVSKNFRHWTESPEYAADLAGFIIPHSYHWLKGAVADLNAKMAGNAWESAVFLGFIAFPLGLWSAIKSKIKYKKYFIYLALAGLVLSLGDCPVILGKPIGFIKLPGYLFDFIPGLDAIRSPGRFIFLTYLALGVLIAAGSEMIIAAAKAKAVWIARLAPVLLGLLLFFDFWSIPFELTRIPIPEFYYRLRQEPSDYSIVNIPFDKITSIERHMFYQTVHHKPLSSGFLARFDPDYYTRLMSKPISKSYFISRKIKYVIIHAEQLPKSEYDRFFRRFSDEFEFIETEHGQTLFKVY